ncbi:MAG: HNH endonuclease signature motif containing protein [Rhodospirillales bacterium]|nr:HNH endonuclease signature motif containing protein [Rhodospirillales bacterium]
MNPDSQIPLCCPCGSSSLYRRGLCEPCYNRRRRDRDRFAGQRDRVLARDRCLCRVCYAPDPLVVHHRTPANRPSSLITLCRACHARLHRLGTIDRWVPELLSDLWAEQHPGAPLQLQLPPTRSSEMSGRLSHQS